MLLTFVLDFEKLYYQQHANQLHFIQPCVHILIHMDPKVHHARPAIVTSQWTMECAIGDLGREIHQPSNPFTNLSECASLHCQINALKSILPELAPSKDPWPNGSIDLKDGYVLLRAQEYGSSLMSESASLALEKYFESVGQPI